MGNFRVVIEAIGGHGVDRGKKDGEVVNFFAEGSESPDALAKRFLEVLSWKGFPIVKAELIHWPDTEGSVTDNLVDGVRKGNF